MKVEPECEEEGGHRKIEAPTKHSTKDESEFRNYNKDLRIKYMNLVFFMFFMVFRTKKKKTEN